MIPDIHVPVHYFKMVFFNLRYIIIFFLLIRLYYKRNLDQYGIVINDLPLSDVHIINNQHVNKFTGYEQD